MIFCMLDNPQLPFIAASISHHVNMMTEVIRIPSSVGISNTPGKIEHSIPGKIGSLSSIAWSCNLSIGPSSDPVGKWFLLTGHC